MTPSIVQRAGVDGVLSAPDGTGGSDTGRWPVRPDTDSRSALRRHAITLRAIAREASVCLSGGAEGALRRGLAEVSTALTALDNDTMSSPEIRALLSCAGVTISHALCVAGVSRDGRSVIELRIRLAACCEVIETDVAFRDR